MRRMKYYKAAIIFFIAFILQTTVLSRIFVLGATPNLLLCLTVVFVYLYDENYGLVYGLVFGALLDITTQLYFGVETLAIVLACIPALFLRRIFNPEKIPPSVLSILLATVINLFGVWTIYAISGVETNIAVVISTIPGLFFSHIILAIVLHLCFVRTIIRHRGDRNYSGGVM